jgi:hypothetical protein
MFAQSSRSVSRARRTHAHKPPHAKHTSPPHCPSAHLCLPKQTRQCKRVQCFTLSSASESVLFRLPAMASCKLRARQVNRGDAAVRWRKEGAPRCVRVCVLASACAHTTGCSASFSASEKTTCRQNCARQCCLWVMTKHEQFPSARPIRHATDITRVPWQSGTPAPLERSTLPTSPSAPAASDRGGTPCPRHEDQVGWPRPLSTVFTSTSPAPTLAQPRVLR